MGTRGKSAAGIVAALAAIAAPLLTGAPMPAVFAQSRQRPRAGVLVIGGNNQNQRVIGHGRDVLISGNGNKVLIRGSATTVRVTGSHNEVRVQTVRQIEAAGRDNRVFYVHGPGGRPVRVFQNASAEVRQDPGAV